MVEDDRLPELDASADLVIRSRQIYENVVADPQRFGSVAEDLVRRARRTRNPEALVLALRAQAWAARGRLANVAAKRLLDEASRIARRYRLDGALADVLMSRAAVNQELGRLGSAQRDLDAASTLASGERSIELIFQQAVLHQNIGRLDTAAQAYRDLLARPESPVRTKAIAANNLAIIETQSGRYLDALRRLEDAAHYADRVGPAVTVLVAQTRAWVTVQTGRLADGLRQFQAAAAAYTAANLSLGEHWIEYADALMDLRLIPEALAAARSAVEEFRAGNVSLMGSEAQLRVAQLALLAGDPAEAADAATAAADWFARQGRPVWKARAVLVIAEARLQAGAAAPADLRTVRRAARTLAAAGTAAAAVYAHLISGRLAAQFGRRTEAAGAFLRAGQLAEHSPVLVRLRGYLAYALAARLREQHQAVLGYCRRALNDLARHRSALPSVELRALASGHGAELGQLALEIVVRDGSPGQVLAWMERTRAAALIAVEPSSFEEIKGDLEELRSVQAELDVVPPRPDRAAATGELLEKQRAIETRIRRATWQQEPGHRPAALPVTTARLRQLLAGRVLVEYGQLADQLIAVVVEPRRSRTVALGPIAPAQEQVRTLLFALRRLGGSDRPSSLSAARQSADVRISRLTEMLLRPLRLPAAAELVVVPVGVLHGIPWSALHDGPVSLAPSATAWARTREAACAHRPAGGIGRVALIAGPHLSGAAAEVQALKVIHHGATVVTPPASTAAAVVDLLGHSDLAHLACHGLLRSDNPMFSALLLSDGPLTIQEIEARSHPPHRLVLASCQSGADVNYSGDEVLGFVSALLARGTAGILASIAAIPDLAAVDLMRAVHERLARGQTLACALHSARATLDREDPRTYVNWCTFSAYGAA
jgi:CHAT domain-containing protein/tetratricopeptide (TPR) repeat protein